MKLENLKLTNRRELYLKNSLGLSTIQDLVNYLPRKYENLTISEELRHDSKVVVLAKVVEELNVTRIRKNLTKGDFYVEINGDLYKIIIFNRDFLKRYLSVGQRIKVEGKLNYYRREIVASNIYFNISENIVTKYNLDKGMNDKEFKSLVNKGLKVLESNNINLNIVPKTYIEKYQLLDKLKCLYLAHNPSNINQVKRAFRHLKYEELLELVTSLEINRRIIKSGGNSKKKLVNLSLLEEFYTTLPYELTISQKSAIMEIVSDLQKPSNMYRILQGDVGSGKTLVALSSMIAAVSASYQAAMMAPTDLLVRQHYESLKNFIKQDINIAFLVSSMTNKEKARIKEDLENGKIDIIVGTHSLIQKDVNFKKLGMVVIDEQHRFGVEQRRLLREKGEAVDLLLMSATPIPRSLAQTVYGDLDISTLEGYPNGKRNITTKVLVNKDKETIFKYARENLEKNNKIFVVCPLIEGDSSKDVSSVYELFLGEFAKYGVGFLHGKLDEITKVQTLSDFDNGKIKIVVSTTVIEVGIDIKGANAIFVYGSEHFGMAQLHQLRGRIARDGNKGECFLLTSKDDPEVLERLNFLASTQDGFKISRYDMQRRGIGDIIGSRQSGVSDLKMANIIDDYHILEVARKDAKNIFNNQSIKEFNDYIKRIEKKMKTNLTMLN